ncbi:hypothetical protein OGAPHI_005957 [Ogataea philodendri]|uniref:Uncharacterized protein n=1 Tax=Ogataea philodendri TaxID=1378263 RepID=A0A9P8NYH4_9ASCO|nr:uncharacterized protein OGAPHI_005957 [Ogataea philodendri]KAH3661779.1 hypothetical protein OGAPHI_005957 [Ogataea philodendri]
MWFSAMRLISGAKQLSGDCGESITPLLLSVADSIISTNPEHWSKKDRVNFQSIRNMIFSVKVNLIGESSPK